MTSCLKCLVGEFCGKLASIKEQTAANLFGLVDVFRKKTNEIKKRYVLENLLGV